MSFQEWDMIYYFLLALAIFIFLYRRFERKSLDWISRYFFKKPNNIYKTKNILFYIGVALFALASLDLRGPEESVKVEMKTQKTIMLIDVSASMAVEDVRPNRFEKALMVAMHFVKKSVGHKIAVFIFSNETKQVVPFTDDVDHINARIEALNQYRTLSGTSNLSLAINEVSKYFKEEGEKGGNILVFTDGEEHASSIDIDLDDAISLGIVGVGTARGGKIPIRDHYNVLRGHKKFKGEEVVSKLNEDFLKNSFKDIENYNYWIVSGYAIPTDQILNFFKKSFISKIRKGVQRIRPVWANLLLVPACLFIMLSYLLGHFRLVKGVSATLLILFSLNIFPQDQPPEKPKLNEEELKIFNSLLDKHKKGIISKKEEKLLAGKFLKQKDFKRASMLYDDAIAFPEREKLNTLMNYGTSLIGSKEFAKGIDMLDMALSKVPKDDEQTKEEIRQNILLALKQEEQRKKEQQKNKDKKKDDKKQKKENKDKSDKKDDKKKGDKEEQKKDQKKKNENKKDEKKDKGDPKDSKDQKKKNDDKKDGQKGKMKKKKLSALMKEILNDDKKLQKKLLDTSRGKKGESSDKDW